MTANKKTADYGAFGVYNSGGIILNDGDGASAQLDSAGRTIVILGDSINSTGVTELIASSGNQAATAISTTLTSAAAKTAYLTGFEVTGAGATAASIVAVTVSGILGGTLTYNLPIPAGVLVGIVPLVIEFPRPLIAAAVNTNIVVSVASFGTGNTNAAVVAHGFLK